MQLNSTEISELIKQRIAQFEVVSEARNEGTIVSVTDGIIRINGLADCMQGEMIELPGNRYAIALNLERSSVGAVVMGPYADLREGIKVKATGRILEVPVGPALLGRVVNTLGEPIDGKGPNCSNCICTGRKNCTRRYRPSIGRSANANWLQISGRDDSNRPWPA